LHHWARAWMKFKHACARKIMHCWWRSRKGRLLAHLEYKARLLDSMRDKRRKLRRYNAATKVQAIVRGIWSRRWVKRQRAAYTIQRPLRFFLARKRWKREARERNLKVVRKYVGNCIGRALIDRTNYLLRLHSKMVIKPQALIRGFLVRVAMQRAKEYAFKFGLAVVKIQRFWRCSGAMLKAVQEVS
jgi:hypothetical protein